MLRLSFSLLLSFLFLSLHSQSSQTIGLHIGTTHSFRTLELTDDNNHIGPFILLNKSKDKTKTQFTVGIDYTFPLTEKLCFETGLLYQNLGYNNPDSYFRYPNQHDGQGGLISYAYNDYLTIHTFSVPILLTYNLFSIGKSDINIGLGSIISYVAKVKQINIQDNGIEVTEIPTPFPNEYKPIQIGASIQLNYSYQLTEHFNLHLTPSFNYYFTQNEANLIIENLYTFRSTVGLSYNL